MKKLGAWSMLVTIAGGLFLIGSSIISSVAAWTETRSLLFHLQDRVGALESGSSKVDRLFKLNCKIAIQVIKDKKVVQDICYEQ